jgi:NhaP-type Na+/H+ or K+/H+ antiporter
MEPLYPALALTGAVFLVFGVMSKPLRTGLLTAPMLAVAAGILASTLLGLQSHLRLDSPVIGAIGEIALAIVLFTDASGVDRKRLRREWMLPARLLAIGLPLTMVAGALVGRLVLPDVPWMWLAAIAVILAPTDAALGIAILLNESVPQRIRDALNVESGLNDGIALPVLVAVLAALAAPADASRDLGWIITAAADIALGAALGAAFGVVGGRMVDAAWKRGWIDETFARLVCPGLAILTFTAAHLLDKNGFVAAYVAGVMLGVRTEGLRERIRNFGEADGTQFSLLVFLLFGMVFVPATWSQWTPAVLAYALLSLTVARMLPVALGLAGCRLGLPTVAFMGWSGPRGIASVLYLAMVAQQFPQRPPVVDAAITLTVLLSVALHGLSAAPLAAAYGRRCSRTGAAGAAPRAAD